MYFEVRSRCMDVVHVVWTERQHSDASVIDASMETELSSFAGVEQETQFYDTVQ